MFRHVTLDLRGGLTHVRWSVTGRPGKWFVQPSGRNRVGTSFGPSVGEFATKRLAREEAKRRNAEGPPPLSAFERKPVQKASAS